MGRVLELGVDPHGRLVDRLDLRVDERDHSAELLAVDRMRAAADAADLGLELDDHPLADPRRRLDRQEGEDAELVEVADLDDRLAGADALARLLEPLEDHARERRPDDVLLELILGQLELGHGEGLLLLGLLDHGDRHPQLGHGLLDVFLGDVVRVLAEQPVVPRDDGDGLVLLGLGLLDGAGVLRRDLGLADGELGLLVVERSRSGRSSRRSCRSRARSTRGCPRSAGRPSTSRSTRPWRRCPGRRRRRSGTRTAAGPGSWRSPRPTGRTSRRRPWRGSFAGGA